MLFLPNDDVPVPGPSSFGRRNVRRPRRVVRSDGEMTVILPNSPPDRKRGGDAGEGTQGGDAGEGTQGRGAPR